MIRAWFGILFMALACVPAGAQVPLLSEPEIRALAAELSGTTAKRNLQDLTLFHRMRGSRGFRAAAERVRDRAREYGLQEVEILELPADGSIFYGTQRSRPAWDADFAELWDGERLVASWQARPVVLAQDSASGEADADLIDVGAGNTEASYQGKEVRGRLVLTSSQPEGAYALAVERFGAAGIISYAQNQVTGWWREDETLVRWGHMGTFPPPRTFGFMVSLQQARAWQDRMARGETVRLRASVRAGQHPGHYSIPTAVIPGEKRDEEIVLSCHLDHLQPGANDNASGCATILEVGRTLAKLIREGRLAPPRRTIRFVWPPEIEGTIALLNAKPEMAARARAVIHMDMVGGDAEITKAVFHVTRSPASLPTFVNDVGEAFGRFVNEQSYAFAATGRAAYPLVDPEGSKRALQAEMSIYSEGSDHQVWAEGSWRVPAIYLNDWPDRYIHTHADGVANIDATKLLRAGFLGAASAYYLATLDSSRVPALWEEVRRNSLKRAAVALSRQAERDNVLRYQLAYERGVLESITAYGPIPSGEEHLAALRTLMGVKEQAPASSGTVYRRAAEPKGPMDGFGYSYFRDKTTQKPALLQRRPLWSEASYDYEALNLVDGKRTVQQIRDDLSAIYGPVPIEEVAEYLEVLVQIKVLERAEARTPSAAAD